MKRSEILEKYGLDGRPEAEEATVSMILLYYMKRLEELKLIEGETYRFTPKGFDMVLDILDDGWRLSEKEVVEFLMGLEFLENEDDLEAVAGTVLHLQEVGFDKLKAELEEFKKEEDFI
jgi:hypothetical protein